MTADNAQQVQYVMQLFTVRLHEPLWVFKLSVVSLQGRTYWRNWKQESWATAKMTARWALHVGVLKIFESPWVRPCRATFREIFNGFLFRSILWIFVQNLKFVALPIHEIIVIEVLGSVLRTPNLEEAVRGRGWTDGTVRIKERWWLVKSFRPLIIIIGLPPHKFQPIMASVCQCMSVYAPVWLAPR